ncbi:alpha/beta hydrolase [Pseudostreptobacillus hongkongensis]|uniref:alpha/beta hydrolase n=1 Tax=Pseudostreptobacillus hongkongensis TaxID=1162717 RepID=UPI00082FF0C5|nr:alpha/beta hydrolase [Pseudostreptobacillus hongkongensis]
MKKEYFYGEDSIHTMQWSIENPKGVVQIVHGMLEYIENYDEFAKFLNKNGYVVLGKIVKIFKGGNYRSKFLNLLTTEKLNKMLGSSTKTKGDWLSRDEKEVEKVLSDEYRQFIPTVNMSLGIFELTNYVRKRKNIKKIRQDLPILLISGGKDPLGNFGKGIEKLDGIMKSEGLNTTVIIYDGSRHELLHELNKEEVMNDILKWIESK